MNTLVVLPQYGYGPHRQAIREFCAENSITLVQYLYTNLAFVPGARPGLFATDISGSPFRGRLDCETRLCATSREALRAFREGARRYLGESVDSGDTVLLATPDGRLLCECPRCRSLDAVGQWQPFLEIAVEEIGRCGKEISTHFIAYIGRFRPPEDLSVFEKIDAVMFDTHLRYRWRPLGEAHPTGTVEAEEGMADPSASGRPINVYLLEKIREWREAFGGKLYVFENLMIQGTMSLPQPNTPALLRDIETFREIGLDGVIYEAFEPGIGAFESQLAVLSAALAGEPVQYAPTPIERACAEIDAENCSRMRLLNYLSETGCGSGEFLAEMTGRSELRELADGLTQFRNAPSYGGWMRIVRHALRHRETIDWIYIIYRLATLLPESERPDGLSPQQAKIFATPKPWDFLEGMADPQKTMFELFRSFPEEIDRAGWRARRSEEAQLAQAIGA